MFNSLVYLLMTQELLVAQSKRVQAADAELVRRALAEGGAEAFCELVSRYKGMVMGQVLQIVRDYHAAEDAAQEVFLKAFKSLGALDKAESFPSWIITIARNTALTHVARRKDASIEDVTETPDGERAMENFLPPDESADPGEVISRREITAKVMKAVNELPEAYRATVYLKYLKGHTCAEIAGMQGEKLGVITSRLTRANAMLRDKLASVIKGGLFQ